MNLQGLWKAGILFVDYLSNHQLLKWFLLNWVTSGRIMDACITVNCIGFVEGEIVYFKARHFHLPLRIKGGYLKQTSVDLQTPVTHQ